MQCSLEVRDLKGCRQGLAIAVGSAILENGPGFLFSQTLCELRHVPSHPESEVFFSSVVSHYLQEHIVRITFLLLSLSQCPETRDLRAERWSLAARGLRPAQMLGAGDSAPAFK